MLEQTVQNEYRFVLCFIIHVSVFEVIKRRLCNNFGVSDFTLFGLAVEEFIDPECCDKRQRIIRRFKAPHTKKKQKQKYNKKKPPTKQHGQRK